MIPSPMADSGTEEGRWPHSTLGLLMGVSLRQQAVLFRQLATMIDSGLTSGRALQSLSAHTPGHFGEALKAMTEGLNRGLPLHKCMARYPEYFSELTVSLVQAGETGGQLDRRLNGLADALEKTYEMRQRLLSQCAYPVLLLHAAIFLPQLFLLFTQGLMAYLVAVMIPLAVLYGTVGLLLAVTRASAVSLATRMVVDAFALSVPLLGAVLRDGAVMRFLRALADLLEAGLSLGRAVEIAARASGNTVISRRLAGVDEQVQSGSSFSAALASTGVLPPSALQMVVTGEQTGTLSASVLKAAELLAIDFDNALRRMASVLPPILMLAVGGFVAWRCITLFQTTVQQVYSVMP
ncbi:MAG: type II secretion system F family protein [Proteobacteria bacterium]|nr:type II secretion system F family protein [Pseudomonadota bacterium]